MVFDRDTPCAFHVFHIFMIRHSVDSDISISHALKKAFDRENEKLTR